MVMVRRWAIRRAWFVGQGWLSRALERRRAPAVPPCFLSRLGSQATFRRPQHCTSATGAASARVSDSVSGSVKNIFSCHIFSSTPDGAAHGSEKIWFCPHAQLCSRRCTSVVLRGSHLRTFPEAPSNLCLPPVRQVVRLPSGAHPLGWPRGGRSVRGRTVDTHRRRRATVPIRTTAIAESGP